jgi:CBS domain-containing protein
MRIGDLCNRTVVVAEPHESAAAIAALMRGHHVGCVVIVQGDRARRVPVGIVTDRDLALAVVAEDRPAARTPVAVAMTSALYQAREEQDAYDVLEQMRARGLRRVPVIDDVGVLQGIFTFDDFIEWTAEQMLQLAAVVRSELKHEASRQGTMP